MAQRTQIIMSDDLDGSEVEGIKTISFGLDGTTYEIDLSPDNYRKMVGVMDVFIEKGRRTDGKRRYRRRGTNASS